ncbi:hypothetical protein ES332_D09G170300v1 [Gossypium tomentosum]|uniref:RNase H type-1 domain-containing protein n=1 Tax=Gossypium tomentosum TaxID=34277 RepID=A0A5D2JHT3_GOSTO|nr:hypothetical protein ES332_D09G170300v1 [Gossypium tomentosum]
MIHGKDELWVKLLLAKYVQGRLETRNVQNVSNIWSSLRKVSGLLQEGIRWVVRKERLTGSVNQSLNDWIINNITSKKWHPIHSIPWKVLFAFTIWQIWLTRNKKIFAGKELYNDVTNKAMEHFVISAPIKSFPILSDGSALSNSGKAGAGVLIRDSKGDWIVGSYRHSPLHTSVCAEL